MLVSYIDRISHFVRDTPIQLFSLLIIILIP